MEKMTPTQAKEELQLQLRSQMMAAAISGQPSHMEIVSRFKQAVDIAIEAIDLMDKQLDIEKKED